MGMGRVMMTIPNEDDYALLFRFPFSFSLSSFSFSLSPPFFSNYFLILLHAPRIYMHIVVLSLLFFSLPLFFSLWGGGEGWVPVVLKKLERRGIGLDWIGYFCIIIDSRRRDGLEGMG